jgi:regulator of protease activity HflC (stomatin/prohibitin superfamily)
MSTFGGILIFFGVIGLLAGLGLWISANNRSSGNKTYQAKTIKLTCSVAAVVIVIGVLLTSFLSIPTGFRGVVLQFGGATDRTMGEGLNFRVPFIQSVKVMSIQTQIHQVEATAASKDLQDVTTRIAVNYKLDPKKVNEIYSTLGMDYETRIIAPFTQEAVKANSSLYTVEEMILKRDIVKQSITQSLITRLAERGIIVETVNLTNFNPSEQFNKAIEDKMVALQSVLTAQNKLQQIEVEAKQTAARAEGEKQAAILQAEGQKQASILKAEGEAKSIQIVTDAQATANQSIADSLSQNVLQYILLDRMGEDIKVIVVPAGQALTLGDIASTK